MSVLMVVCSCPDQASAAALAQTLVERRLAACVNLLPPMQSVYRYMAWNAVGPIIKQQVNKPANG